MHKNFARILGIGFLSASLVSCGHKLVKLEPGEYRAAGISCKSYVPDGWMVRCEYPDRSETETAYGELVYFTVVNDGRTDIYYAGSKPVNVDGFIIHPEKGRLAKGARKKHYEAVEFFHNSEKSKKGEK